MKTTDNGRAVCGVAAIYMKYFQHDDEYFSFGGRPN